MMKKGFSYSALFFLADYYAAECVSTFQKNKISVPDDISIVSFDNTIYSQISHPQLTTVHQDIGARGRYAIDMLFSLIDGKDIEQNDVNMPVHLIIRDSVRKK